LALLAALAVDTVRVRRAPKVRLVVRGPKHGPDVLTDLLSALAVQDGAVVSRDDGDIVVVAGGGGEGADDEAPAPLDIHGIAIRPGGSSGLGWRDGRPLLLLPGEPLACLAAYTLLAQRLLRRMGGLGPTQTVAARLTRKIVSGVGVTDFVRVRLDGERAEPLGALETGGLAGAARSDGYVVVPEASEGYPPGSPVAVQLWEA
jgi:molybdopterin molybdotransferase